VKDVGERWMKSLGGDALVKQRSKRFGRKFISGCIGDLNLRAIKVRQRLILTCSFSIVIPAPAPE
jgi:hypothetical protein